MRWSRRHQAGSTCFLASSDLHLEAKLTHYAGSRRSSRRLRHQYALACTYCEDVEFSAEDATRSDPAHFLTQIVQARGAVRGATTINLPDTVGYTTPDEYKCAVSAHAA